MGQDNFSAASSQNSISLIVPTGGPFPTACIPINLNFGNESVNHGSFHSER